MSGVPSLLGRTGGVALGEGALALRPAFPIVKGGDATTGWVGLCASLFAGSGPETLSAWCADDFRGGGLTGGAPACFWAFLSVPRTVELDDEDVRDSLTAARPSGSPLRTSASPDKLLPLRRVTGGRVRPGLPCCILGGAKRVGKTRPGDWDDMDVGVVSRLYGPVPGDSENLVDGLPLIVLSWLPVPEKYPGVGGGRS